MGYTVLSREDLHRDGTGYEFEGYLHGDTNITIILVDLPPGRGHTPWPVTCWNTSTTPGPERRSTMAQAIDPVCNMTVDTETAEHKSEYQGTTYYFCAAGCKRAFDKNPMEYTGQAGQSSGSGSMGHGEHH